MCLVGDEKEEYMQSQSHRYNTDIEWEKTNKK